MSGLTYCACGALVPDHGLRCDECGSLPPFDRIGEPGAYAPASAPAPCAAISVVCWLWRAPGYRTAFHVEHVNALRAAVERHYAAPHRFICVTNETEGFDAGVELARDREDFAAVPSPHGHPNPSCYRRLRLFAPDAGATFGERFVSLDLDCVITGDLQPLWDRPDNFVIWRDPGGRTPYCGSMMLLRAGARLQVWNDFDPKASPQAALTAGCMGSDQGWIAHCLGPHEATWTAADGVLSYKRDALRRNFLPAGARIVFFHGRPKPWDPEPRALAWVREHSVAPKPLPIAG